MPPKSACSILRRWIKIHMALAGGPSVPLCGVLLKSIDVIETWLQDGQCPTEQLLIMARSIAVGLGSTTLDRLEQQRLERNNENLEAAHAQLQALVEAAPSLVLDNHFFYRMLQVLNAAFLALQEATLVEYPNIKAIGP